MCRPTVNLRAAFHDAWHRVPQTYITDSPLMASVRRRLQGIVGDEDGRVHYK